MATIKGFQDEVWGLHVAVPAYSVTRSEMLALDEAREQVPDTGFDKEIELVSLARKAYGKRFKVLTAPMAKKLAGKTVVALTGQLWMDHVGSDKGARAKMPTLITIHGVFDAPKQEKTCIVSELEVGARAVKRLATYGTYLWKGYYGSGSGHDPVLVFIA